MSHKSEAVDHLVKIYRSLAKYPTPTSGRILKRESGSNDIKIQSTWSQKNLEKGKPTKFQQYHLVSPASFDFLPVDTSSEQSSSTSTSGKCSAILREGLPENSSKKQFLEIWEQGRLLKNFDVLAFDIHGEIYFDGEFGSLEWSPDEQKVLYIAEKKIPKSEPFYSQKPQEAKEKSLKKPSVVGEEYTFKADWGEQLVDKHQPVIGLCDVNSETLQLLSGIPSNYSPGQVLWAKGGDGIFGVVLENEPRRLGLIYCTNRLSYIFHLSLSGEFIILSEKNQSVRSPRLSLDGNYLFWLQRPAQGAHDGCQQLIKCNLATHEKEVVIDVVRRGADFCGLFTHNLPKRCFSKDGKKLFFSAISKCSIESYFLDLETQDLHKLKIDTGSLLILDVYEDAILCASSSLQSPPSLKMSMSVDDIKWIDVTRSEIVIKDGIVKHFEYNLPHTKENNFTYFNAIYLGPPQPVSDEKIPLVVFPHGGPHSSIPDSFIFDATFFASMGMGVLMVNYRGSTGAGQDSIDFLLGKIGDTDVKDVQYALTETLKAVPYIDSKKVVLYGGSHGGFLVTHLSAQYPESYKAVVARNPVIDVATMFTISDIPDWSSVESGFNFQETLTPAMAQKMLEVSPIHLIDKVQAPTLLMIGKKDLRVPPSQGLYYYNALKARNAKTRLNLYDDNHPLGQVPVHLDSLINSGLWFIQHLEITAS